MLKPVVNMNKMAMNESIATTCCFVWNGTSYAGSATMPHGGTLVAKYNTAYYLKTNRGLEISKGWINWKGGHITNRVLMADAPYESDGKWYCNGVELISANSASLPGLTFNWCDHNNAGCAYEKVSTLASMTHVGATSAHYNYTSGNSSLAVRLCTAGAAEKGGRLVPMLSKGEEGRGEFSCRKLMRRIKKRSDKTGENHLCRVAENCGREKRAPRDFRPFLR